MSTDSFSSIRRTKVEETDLYKQISRKCQREILNYQGVAKFVPFVKKTSNDQAANATKEWVSFSGVDDENEIHGPRYVYAGTPLTFECCQLFHHGCRMGPEKRDAVFDPASLFSSNTNEPLCHTKIDEDPEGRFREKGQSKNDTLTSSKEDEKKPVQNFYVQRRPLPMTPQTWLSMNPKQRHDNLFYAVDQQEYGFRFPC